MSADEIYIHTIHVLQIPDERPDSKPRYTPYAVTLKGEVSPVAHATSDGLSVREESLDVFPPIIKKGDVEDLPLIVREFFPEGTEIAKMHEMLHG